MGKKVHEYDITKYHDFNSKLDTPDIMSGPVSANSQGITSNKYRKKLALEASKPSDPSFDGKGAAQGAAKAIEKGGSGADVLAGGLMGSSNPYAMAAGVGLGMMSASAKRKREAANKREEHRYTSEIDRRNSTMRALQAAQQAASALG